MMEKFNTEQKTKIIELYFENHRSIILTQRAYRRHYNVRQAPNQTTIDRLVNRFRQQGSVVDLPRTGRPHSVRIAENVALVQENRKEEPEENVPAKRVCLETDEGDSSSQKKFNFKIISWNVNGVRAWIKKDGLDFLKNENPDVICLQETKCSLKKMPSEIKSLKGYHSYFAEATKEGYSGVGFLTKVKPIDVKIGIEAKTHDDEGRCITAEYKDYYVVCAYVPNAGRQLVTLDKRMDWDGKLKEYLKQLNVKKPIVYCGDLNVAHSEIDLANPKTNQRNAGFTIEERNGFSDLLDNGFIDSFRHLYPKKEKQYTFWNYMMNSRARNIGWRLDYFVISKKILKNLSDNVIHSSIMGSDHCPISLQMQF